MSEANSSSSWMNSCSGTHDLVLPLIPYIHCPYNRKYGVHILPLVFHMFSVIGIIGNLGSLWTCLRPSQPWSIGSIGVLNLALCDLTYLGSVAPWAVYMSTDYNWGMGRVSCFLVNISYFVGVTSSTLFICAISVDRFLALVFPLESRMFRTTRNSALVSLLLWAITALLMYLGYPNIVYWVRKDGVHICGAVVISKYRVNKAAYNLLSYYYIQVSVPLLLIIPSYVKIIARMRQSRQQLGQANSRVRDKPIWLISVFIANFLICWVPGQLLHIVACIIFFNINDCSNTCWVAWVVNVLMETSQLLYCLNACLDPFIFHLHQGCLEQLHRAVHWLTSCGQRWQQKKNKQNLAAPPTPVSVIQLQSSKDKHTVVKKQ
ncbi:uracil nucleotide/cysteinyl leukotriene receptor-like [Astyanax mexicanus]|uniref:Uracil nucleotide/cysteinyl leukotriene receptor-like n=1 Tax=Astyanax mexicanus TaxID=7994 RepID=A0A8T2LFA0_ASTMX|nr:uracil nucleotide/cysteinyl leukotriene receptor-like [Astyanax mexicanus]